jgi:hypothetical protein
MLRIPSLLIVDGADARGTNDEMVARWLLIG